MLVYVKNKRPQRIDGVVSSHITIGMINIIEEKKLSDGVYDIDVDKKTVISNPISEDSEEYILLTKGYIVGGTNE